MWNNLYKKQTFKFRCKNKVKNENLNNELLLLGENIRPIEKYNYILITLKLFTIAKNQL